MDDELWSDLDDARQRAVTEMEFWRNYDERAKRVAWSDTFKAVREGIEIGSEGYQKLNIDWERLQKQVMKRMERFDD